MKALILFPNQLFANATQQRLPDESIVILEHPLFYDQLPFHALKKIFHHVSIRTFAENLQGKGVDTTIITLEELRATPVTDALLNVGVSAIRYFAPYDDYLQRELQSLTNVLQIEELPAPAFLTPLEEWKAVTAHRKTVRMQDFYTWQRKRLDVLVENGAPIGGKWSLDTENRKPLPKDIVAPKPYTPLFTATEIASIHEAVSRFSLPPETTDQFVYGVSHTHAKEALDYFLHKKLATFGDYEDAVHSEDGVLFHSQLSHFLNAGLLTPQEVLDATLEHTKHHDIPLNSLEGFIRQLIGWREYVACTYMTHGKKVRTSNVLNHTNSIPERFWQANTGLLPLDHALRGVQKTAYSHHIERLMILGVFFLLTETSPNEVFDWFFANYIDAYDWVMVTNVYSMSQYADGGLLTTKPYICGSAYLRKMTNFPKGEWCDIWDALYWRWVSRHQELLRKNPRTMMSVSLWNKFSKEKQSQLLATADTFLETYYA